MDRKYSYENVDDEPPSPRLHTSSWTGKPKPPGLMELEDEEDSFIEMMPLPDVNSTLDGIGRPSPLRPEANYVEVRRLKQEEILKCEKNKPPLPRQAEEISSTFRPIDSLHAKTTNDEDTKTLRVEDVLHKSIPDPALQNTCVEIQEDRRHRGKMLAKQCLHDRDRNTKKYWREQLPPDIHSLPVYAIRVRWPIGHHSWVYTLELLHVLLSRFGTIVSVGELSQNSAVVVFQDVKTAAQVIRCSQLSTPSHFICTWWYEEMWNYNRMDTERKLREVLKPLRHLDEMTIFRMKFKLLQNKIADQLRKRAKKLHYDLNAFIP